LLEGTRQEDVAQLIDDITFPQQVFAARYVVFSRINEQHAFEIVEQIDLKPNDERRTTNDGGRWSG
jgi:hypothetical protein